MFASFTKSFLLCTQIRFQICTYAIQSLASLQHYAHLEIRRATSDYKTHQALQGKSNGLIMRSSSFTRLEKFFLWPRLRRSFLLCSRDFVVRKSDVQSTLVSVQACVLNG